MPENQEPITDVLEAAIEARDGSAFLKAAETVHYADLAAVYERLDEDEKREFFLKTLSPERFSEVLPELPDGLIEESLDQFKPSQQREILEAIPDDDLVDVLQDVSPEARSRYIDLLPKEDKELTRTLLNYGEETAGGRMTTQIGRIDRHLTVRGALDALRKDLEDTETLGRIMVIDESQKPVGVLRLRDLAFSSWNTPVADIMRPVEQSILATADQEEAANMVAKYDLVILPVVDEAGRLLGAITHDDAIEILEEESTEDIEKAAGLTGEGPEEGYLHTTIWMHFRRRFAWLLILAFLAIGAGYVMLRFETVLEKVFLLSLFLPMVIAAGGNTGGQASTMVIRAMALGELERGNMLRVAWKELRLGLCLGLLLGLCLAAACILLLPAFRPELEPGIGYGRIGMSVAIALALQVTTSTLIGALLPLIARQIKLDPAVIAAPAITTVVDASGMVIYFTVARAILGL